jgi:hypothetical protein
MNRVVRLQELLNAARVSDDEIRGGIRLSPGGLEKLASRLGTSSEEVKRLISDLTKRLQDEHDHDVTVVYEGEGEVRFVYEADFLGNLTVRDTKTGEDHYLAGSDSAHVIKTLRATEAGSQAEQALLRRIAADVTTQPLEEDGEVADDFVSELKNDAGSYNFPWNVNGHNGTGTAAYRANAKEFKLEVVSIRDSRGDEIEVGETTRQAITKQARDFIGQE